MLINSRRRLESIAGRPTGLLPVLLLTLKLLALTDALEIRPLGYSTLNWNSVHRPLLVRRASSCLFGNLRCRDWRGGRNCLLESGSGSRNRGIFHGWGDGDRCGYLSNRDNFLFNNLRSGHRFRCGRRRFGDWGSRWRW